MTTAVQHRRGTTAEHATFTGLEGEVTIDTTKDTAVIHDGVLAGGVPLARENLANVTPSGLATITGASTASDDKFFIYDQSATTLKSITRAELNNAMEIDALANVTITGGTINGTTIGNTTAAAGTFTNLTASGTVTIPDNAISGDKVEGGTINAITINTLTATNNPTLSAGTANGVTYLNGSKVLTSGSALTFDGSTFTTTAGIEGTKLTTAGNISLYNSVSSQLTHYQQLSSAYTASYIQSALSGASSSLVFAVNSNWTNGNATEQMRLTSTGLGIGTSSPSQKLHVASTSNAQGLFETTGAGGGSNRSSVILQGPSSTWYINTNGSDLNGSDGALGFYGNSATRMVIDTSGNLGLGVTPSAWISAYKGFDIGTTTSLYGRTDSTMEFALALNGYRASSGSWLYRNNGAAARYNQNSGTHWWDVAPSGTAGNAISFTQAMTLTAAGNLGVGTSSITSGFKLDVLGDARFSDVAGDDGVELGWSAGGSAGFVQAYDRGASAFRDLSLNNAVTISSSGNVGIGTSSPSGKLQVKQANTAYGLVVEASGNDAWVRFHHNDSLGIVETTYNTSAGYTPLTFKTGGTERMRIDSSGNVGIGTSSPTDKLSVGTSAGGTQVKIQSGSGVNNCILHTNGTTDSWRVGMNLSLTNGSYEFYDDINNVTRLILDSSGNLLVGTTSNSRGARLRVEGLETAHFTGYGNGYGIGLWMTPNPSATGGTATPVSFQNVSDATVGSITTTASATAYNTSSDYRLKEDWVAVADASTRVNALKPVNFAWKVNGSRVDGFLAHELAEVVPEAVSGEKDAVDAEGKPVYQGIDQSKLVPLLTAALQEALAKIESLTARVSALEGN
jgi:hypothetical protein